MENREYNIIYHFDTSIKTISGIISDPNSKIKGWNVGGFLCYKNSDGKTNLESIYELLKFGDTTDNKSTFESKKTADINRAKLLPEALHSSFSPAYDIIKSGTTLYIPINRFNSGIPITRNDKVIKGNISDIQISIMKKIIAETGKTKFSVSGYSEESPDVSVWIACKALASTEDHVSSKLLNITPFVHDVNINKNRDGGFSIKAVVTQGSYNVGSGEFSAVGKWINEVNNKYYADLPVVSKRDDGSLKRTELYLKNIITENDVVFIRFETSNGEDREMDYDMMAVELDPSIIEGKVYDMIGLVTGHSVSTNSSGDVSLNINGGDLTKALTIDGSGIYAQRFISSGVVSDIADFSGGILRFQGKYVSQFQLVDQAIPDQIRFIIDYLSRSRICGDVLDYYRNARTDKLEVPESSVIKTPVKGIWRIIDIMVDDYVGKIRGYNTQIGNAYDSIWSQIQKCCVEPFVELFTDTYGDKFYIIARRPPYDKDSINQFKDNNLIVEINEHEIMSDNLSYENTAYSWYKIDNKFVSMFLPDSASWLIPAIYFEEYADIWGDRPYRASNPYIDLMERSMNDKDKVLGRNIIMQSIYDLKYVIETSMYLPFTRRGSITLSGGRRDIKRGMWIFNKGSGELMYVDSVVHSYGITGSTIDRVTSLSVSRGMISSEIDKYFSIIDMGIKELRADQDFAKYIDDTLRTWKVNRSIFNDMMRRRMNSTGELKRIK